MSVPIRAFSLPVSGVFYRGADLFVTTKVDKLDKGGSIVGYTGALLRVIGEKTETVFESNEEALLGGTALASGDLAVTTTDSKILVIGPKGNVRKRVPSGLMPYHSGDHIVAGGTPEVLVVASRAYSNAKSSRAAQWDTASWKEGKPIAFTSLSPLSVSTRGVARTTGKGYDNVDSWGVQEFAWKGAPKAIKTPTQRSSWCASTPAGWLVSDSNTAAFVEPNGKVRWTIKESHITAHGLSDTRLAIITFKALLVVDVANGRVVENHRLKLGNSEQFAMPCPIAVSAAGAVAFASEKRLLIVERSAESLEAVGKATFVAKPGPAPAVVAQAAKAAKRVADRDAAAASAVVAAVEALTEEILSTEDVKRIKRAGAKLGKLDVLDASSEPKNEKRIRKCDRALNARMNALKLGSAAREEIAHILDVLNDS